MDLSHAIVSSIPGRLRLRHRALRDPDTRNAAASALRSLAGVSSVEANPATGSLLVFYDPTRCDRAGIERQLGAPPAPAVSAETTTSTARPDAAASHARRAARDGNRAAKLGMMASLPLSLALAAGGNKKLHALTGGAFALLLLVHLVVHRRHLLK